MKDPSVAICMATYNPSIKLFTKQIQSIIDQTFKNWICIINDDCSKPEIFSKIKSIVEIDKRIIIYQNKTRLGFYHNFEKCLSRVPNDVEFVGFADQDDYWYKEKIKKTIENFDENTTLVYCDMKIVDINKQIISKTFWNKRKNNFKNLYQLIFANTVTGAASIFRKNILDIALPFPQKIGDSYHDWWIACIALTIGEIKFIDESLYEYLQHDENVLGHFTGEKTSISSNNIPKFARFAWANYAVFMNDFLRIVLIANELKLRCVNIAPDKLKVINEIVNYENSIKKLVLRTFNSFFHTKVTLGAEKRLLFSVIVTRWYKKYINLNKKKYSNHQEFQTQTKLEDVTTPIFAIEQKIEPLMFKVSENYKKRVNILIPTINFKYFFGGYIAKFNFAKRLASIGENVRIIIVDWTDFKPSEWKKEIVNYSGLENFFDLVEITYAFNRNEPIQINKDDLFVATTWWTAHIANEAIKNVNSKKFLYLIQEYEPFTFPLGSYYALAHQTYSFPHCAIFSTEFLQDYFKENKIGVFSQNTEGGNKNSVFFNNPIVSTEVDPEKIKNKKTRKVLFYARPEPHASRNMFELAFLGLKSAINEGIFESDKWEFHGIGAVNRYQNISLPDNMELKMLPRMGLNEYKKILLDYDIGISPMLTPHPNLVTLEMADAGMIVITNSFENKTQQNLSKVSSNIIAAEPTITGYKNALTEGIKRVNNFESRVEGSKVKWSKNWDEAFDKNKLKEILELVKITN